MRFWACAGRLLYYVRRQKICDEFVETADDEIYNLVRCALEKEFQNTGQKYKRGVKTK